FHRPAGRAELPVRGDGCGSALCDGARPDRRYDTQRPAGGSDGQASHVSRRVIPPRADLTTRESTMVRFLATGVAAALLLAHAASAQISDGVVKIGVLNDQSSVYADLAGQGSVVAARMAVEDFGAAAKGLKVEVITADHQNKADVGSAVARQWIDVDKVDMISDVTNSSVVLAVNQVVKDRNKVLIVSGGATSDLTGKACTPNSVHWTYDTWALANGTGNAVVK